MGCKEALDFLDNVHTVLCLSELIAVTRLSRPLGFQARKEFVAEVRLRPQAVGFSDKVTVKILLPCDRWLALPGRPVILSLGDPSAARRKSSHYELWHDQWPCTPLPSNIAQHCSYRTFLRNL